MDREIKFRVWLPELEGMFYSDYETDDLNLVIYKNRVKVFDGYEDEKPYTNIHKEQECMQWSGLKLDDQDIYEGDLLRSHVTFKGNCYPLLYVVKFFNGTFVCELLDKDHEICRIIGMPEKLNLYNFIHRTFLFLREGVTLTIEKVILEGNIFENKELLNPNKEDK